ncbi:hypothetical protein KR222_008397, partial [Zaprionus bogoriensis]
FAMSRASRSWCRKIVQWTLRSTLYASWALGLFPFVYDSKTTKLKRSIWQLVYGVLLNSTLVLGILKTYSDTESTVRVELYKHNPLVEQVNNLHNYVLLLTIFVTYFRNWWLSADLERIFNAMLRFYHNHFKFYDYKECLYFENFMMFKGLTNFLELASIVAMGVAHSPIFSMRMLLGVICMLAIQLGILLLGMHFHIAAIYIYRFVWIINGELLELFYSPNRSSNKVDKLHRLYKQLLELNLRLVAAYDYQMILFMLSLLTVNIISIYFFIVYNWSLNKPISLIVIFNAFQALSINIMDFWLNIVICELSERASRGTSTILKLFNDIPNLDVDLDRSLTDFALFCSHRRLEYNHCGLFHINNTMGFRMLVSCMLHLVYLLQFDFMNL